MYEIRMPVCPAVQLPVIPAIRIGQRHNRGQSLQSEIFFNVLNGRAKTAREFFETIRRHALISEANHRMPVEQFNDFGHYRMIEMPRHVESCNFQSECL
jgi:hypothetical protein